MTELRKITIPAGHEHTHEGVTFYGPSTITLPAEHAQAVADMVVSARIEMREKAKKVSGTVESAKTE